MTETKSRPRNRALVASFLFTDLVGYSKGTATEQYAAKATLSEILGNSLAALQTSDYRIKDTGDGAVIAFLSNPEHALYMALAIAHDFAGAASRAGFPSNSLRTGIHIGAVEVAIDLEARPNFVGDGINAAKRIMDFAAPGQITASGSFFDAVAGLDSAYAALFQHLGAPGDKHGRAHELYAISPDEEVLERLKLDLASTARESADLEAETTPRTGELSGSTKAGTNGPQSALSQAVEVVRKWFIPINALIAFTIFVAAGLEHVAPKGQGIRMASTALFAIAAIVGSLGLLRARGIGSRFWVRFPRSAFALASRSTSLVAMATALMLGAVSIFLDAWPLDRIAATVRPLVTEPASPAPAAPAPAASTTATDESSRIPLTSPPFPPRSDAASPMRAAQDVEGTRPPELSGPAPVTPAGASNADVAGKSRNATTPAAPMPTTAPADRGSPRCRRIIEKAAIGEPLSRDDKWELANSCR